LVLRAATLVFLLKSSHLKVDHVEIQDLELDTTSALLKYKH